jgi:long-chain acyl-CoA synthetase
MILTKIIETAARYPHSVAVQMKVGDRYQQYTYAQLLMSIASVAAALAGKGIGKGDRLALLSENRPEWMIAYLSTVGLGAVIVPLDAQLTEKEIDLLLADSEAKAVFVSSATARKLPRRHALEIFSFDPGAGPSFQDLLTADPGAVLPPSAAADDLAAILYTSGTTGDPKGVMLSHGNLASNVASTMQLEIVRPGDNMLCILPMHHTYPAHTCMLLPFSSGATVTLLNSLKGPDLTACMKETGVTIMLGVPQLFAGLRRAIFDEIGKKPAVVRVIIRILLGANGLARKTLKVNPGKALFRKVHEKFGSSLRLLASGGARLEPDIFIDMTNIGFTMIEGYGLTETSPVCAFQPVERAKPGSIGIPVPDVELRIANPDENGQGEIAVRGPNVMLGYYRKPEKTAEVLKDGWFYTGDLGYRDRDGYLFVTGRSKEMIVLSTGKKIFPDELEKFYKQIPSIKELCLVQTERGIEAAVVPDFDYLRKMNLSNSRETIAFELEDLARDLPPYKRISGLKIFKESLPATRLGKLKRGLVKDLYLKSGERAEKPVAETDRSLLATPVGRKFLACLEPFSQKKNIVPDDNLELDLGLDSLARVELVVSIEKSFGVSLPDSFGSEIFTVKEAVLKVQDLVESGTVKGGGEQVRLSWADILAQEPEPELRERVRLDHGAFCTAGRAFLNVLVKIVMKTYTRLSVRGLEHLPQKGPFILAPNHLSFADAPAIVASLPWRLGRHAFFLGATQFFGGRLTSQIAKVVQVIPVDMDTRLQGALQLSGFVLQNNKVLCVFPEGSRSRDGRIKEFKKGVAIVARELNIPLIPVALQGTYEVLATGKTFPKPHKVSVTFGPPLKPEGLDYDVIIQELARQVKRLLSEHEK